MEYLEGFGVGLGVGLLIGSVAIRWFSRRK